MKRRMSFTSCGQSARRAGSGVTRAISSFYSGTSPALELRHLHAWERARHPDPLITDLARNMGWMGYFRKTEQDYSKRPDSERDLSSSSSA